MWFQHGRNPHIKGNSWQRIGQNRIRKDKSSERVEDIDKDQRCGEFPQICKLLLMFYSKLQSYSKTIKQAERQEGLEMGRRTPESIRQTQRKDSKSTGPFFTQKRRKI